MRYVDEPEAMEQLANGQVQAVLIFPEHFYKDLDEGNDSFVRLCVPQESDVSSIVTVFTDPSYMNMLDQMYQQMYGVDMEEFWQSYL